MENKEIKDQKVSLGARERFLAVLIQTYPGSNNVQAETKKETPDLMRSLSRWKIVSRLTSKQESGKPRSVCSWCFVIVCLLWRKWSGSVRPSSLNKFAPPTILRATPAGSVPTCHRHCTQEAVYLFGKKVNCSSVLISLSRSLILYCRDGTEFLQNDTFLHTELSRPSNNRSETEIFSHRYKQQ